MDSGPAPGGASRNDGYLHPDAPPYRGELGFVPDADQDAVFHLKLLVGISGDFRIAGGDVVLRVQRPLEQRGLQSRDLTDAGGIIAAVGEFLRVVLQVVEHRPEARSMDVFPAPVE